MTDYTDSPFASEAKEACPWRDTDHRQPGAYNGDTYCVWCEGYVAGAEAQSEMARAKADRYDWLLENSEDDPWWGERAIKVMEAAEAELREARADAVHWSRKWSDLTGEATDLETRAETAEAQVEGLRETLERIAGVRKEDVVGGIMGVAEFARAALSDSRPKDTTE